MVSGIRLRPEACVITREEHCTSCVTWTKLLNLWFIVFTCKMEGVPYHCRFIMKNR